MSALLLGATLHPGSAFAAELTTKTYSIAVTENCGEGDVACQDVSYIGTNRPNGKAIHLKGRTVVAMCKDGITPCHHLGYEFRNGKYTYFVADQGWLQVSRGRELILHEKGTWDPRSSN